MGGTQGSLMGGQVSNGGTMVIWIVDRCPSHPPIFGNPGQPYMIRHEKA